MKNLVLRVAPSNNIQRKFLDMSVFPLKITEKILVKKKVILKRSKNVRRTNEDFKRLKSSL